MIDQYVLATNDDGDLAIRTVSATESSSVTDTTSVITATDDGKLAVRVVGAGGGGGSDPHNLGWYATQAALEEAHPTAEAGDWAIVGSTDTVWLWDTDNEEWVDSDTKGQVTSVNNQTGAVTLGINDVAPTQTGKSGYVLGTDGFVAGWVKPEIVQVSALPTGSADEVDNIYQFVGTTDANYTNGYFYKCVSDGQDPATYSWTQTDVQPQAGGLPSQTGNAGKFLTTDGTDASWSDKPLVNNSNKSGTISIGGQTYQNSNATAVGVSAVCGASGVAIGSGSTSSTNGEGVAIGNNSECMGSAIAIGTSSKNYPGSRFGYYAIAIGYQATSTGNYTIQLGKGSNTNEGTFQVSLQNGNYRMLDANGTIPTDRFTTTPSADGTYVPTLTISSGTATRTWDAAASAPVVPATMPTLAVADWSSNTQTVNVTGVTASNIVFVSPAPASAADYAAAGIVCTVQNTDSLTFECQTVPSNAITLSVVIFN